MVFLPKTARKVEGTQVFVMISKPDFDNVHDFALRNHNEIARLDLFGKEVLKSQIGSVWQRSTKVLKDGKECTVTGSQTANKRQNLSNLNSLSYLQKAQKKC